MYVWMRCPSLLLTLFVTYTLGSAQDRVRVTSPDGRNRVTVEVRDGALAYSVDRDDRAVLLPSHRGFAFQGALPLRDGLRMVDTSRNIVDETWTQPWGEVARVRDHFNFFFSSRRRHTRLQGDWSSDVCSSDLIAPKSAGIRIGKFRIGSITSRRRMFTVRALKMVPVTVMPQVARRITIISWPNWRDRKSVV